MARSVISCRISIANTALDTLFLIVIQALIVIALGKFIHLALRRHNLPSAISQIIVGVRINNAPSPLTFLELVLIRISRRGSSWGAWACKR
jgi:Kef-type K+ transport system membrane component KefB